jgi:hypothetical protein
MTGPSVGQRYWCSLTGSRMLPEPPLEGRGRVGYSFWQRYWASLVGAVLPVTDQAHSARSPARTGSGTEDARTMPTAGRGIGGWFLLPAFDGPAILRASGESRVIAEAATPDGRAELFVRRGDTSRPYHLEIVLRDFEDLPAVVFVRYATVRGTQVLVVPLISSEIGAPSAQVQLPGIDPSQRWEVVGPLSADQAARWDANTVAASVTAAASEATREAWRRVGGSLRPELRRVIEKALQ